MIWGATQYYIEYGSGSGFITLFNLINANDGSGDLTCSGVSIGINLIGAMES
jgi:hypothetical protein